MAEKIPYWSYSRFWKCWVEKTGENGCEICRKDDGDIRLRLDRAPPPLRDQPAVPARKPEPPAPPAEKKDPWLRLAVGIGHVIVAPARFRAWLDKPDPPAIEQPKHQAPPAAPAREQPPPFDIQDIPETARRLGMVKAAAMFERWFAGRLNYSPTEIELAGEINQNGMECPPSMIDSKSVKMDWILGFDRAQRAFNELRQGDSLRAPKALTAIRKIAVREAQNGCRYSLDSMRAVGSSVRALHRGFQFQYITIDASFGAKLLQHVGRLARHRGVPDELTFIFGAFGFYAAIAHAHFNFEGGRKWITITHVYIYVRDGFTFTDKAGSASQYLGHWSKTGVAIVPLTQVSSGTMNVEGLDYPIIEFAQKESGIMRPVKNSDFRHWQIKHGQGGDYIIYTDAKIEKLNNPIKVEF